MPTAAEADEHLERIADVLAEAERLSRIEQGVRPALPTDADAIRILAHHPHAAPEEHQIPQESCLRPLADKHLEDILPKLQQVLTMQQRQQPFHPDVFQLLLEADRQTPGPGTHTAIWGEDGATCIRSTRTTSPSSDPCATSRTISGPDMTVPSAVDTSSS